MKNWLFIYALCLVSLSGFSQNLGYDESNPGSKISLHGNLSVGASYSSIAAPASGAIIQGTVGIGTSSPTDQCQVNDGSIGISNDNNTAGTLKFYEPSTSGTNYMAFKAQAMSANVTYTLPAGDGTSGQVLSTNGSGALSWGTPSGGMASGSAAGNTPYWNGSSWVVNSGNIYNNGANVGVGTTSPQSKLDVNGGMSVGSYAGNNAAPTGGIIASGFIGAGSNAPIANVHIYGNTNSGFTPAYPAGYTPAAGPELGFSRGGFYTLGASIQMLDYNAYSSGLCFNVHKGTNNGGGGTFADNWPTDVVQAMTIDNQGRVGIGTSSPTYLLDVSGTGHYSGSLTVGGALTSGSATVSGSQTVSGSSTISGALAVSGSGTIGGSLAVSGSNTVSGSLAVSGTVSVGTNGSALNAIIKGTATTSSHAISANSTYSTTYTLTNAVTSGSTVHVSPASALASGLIIAYAYVSSSNTITVVYGNITTSSVSLASGITLNIVVVQ